MCCFKVLHIYPSKQTTNTMAATTSSSPLIYATNVGMPYRAPHTCNTFPKYKYDSPNYKRAAIPHRKGLATPTKRPVLYPVTMYNGRELRKHGEVTNVDTHAFDFVENFPTNVTDWNDPEQIYNIYLDEVAALIKEKVPGANHPGSHVLIFDHAMRSGGKGLKELQEQNEESPWQGYAGIVHSDATVRSIHTRAKDQILGTNETEVKYGGKLPKCWGEVKPSYEWQRKLFRSETDDHNSPEGEGGEHMIINVWRPIKPVHQWGLAVLDGRSMKQGDVHPTTINKFDNSPGGRTAGKLKTESKVKDLKGDTVPIRYGEVLTPLPDPKHRWVYYPKMQPKEALLLKIFDSRRDGRVRNGCHTAFRDPTGPNVHRHSIEVRCLVTLPPQSKLAKM